MVKIRSNVHKKTAFCDRDIKRIPSLYMQRINGHSYVRGESRVIVLFLCTSSDHVLYFKIWPWCSLTDLVITINSAYHLSIRKLQAFTGEGDMERTREVWWQMDIWWTDRQANRRTDNITTNNILPVLRWIRGFSVLWRCHQITLTGSSNMAWTLKIKRQPDGRTTSEHNIFTSTVWWIYDHSPPPTHHHRKNKKVDTNSRYILNKGAYSRLNWKYG